MRICPKSLPAPALTADFFCTCGIADGVNLHRCIAGLLTLPPPIVPKGQKMNSRGCTPAVSHASTFDPVGVAHCLHVPPWVATHGYSGWAAMRPREDLLATGTGDHRPKAPNSARISSSTCAGSLSVLAIASRNRWRYRLRNRCTTTLTAPSSMSSALAASA